MGDGLNIDLQDSNMKAQPLTFFVGISAMSTETVFHCETCDGTGAVTLAKPRRIGTSLAVKLTAKCIACGGGGYVLLETEDYEDRRNRMLAIRCDDPDERSRRERARLGIPEGHHRLYGVDVPDAIWRDLAADAYRMRRVLRASIEETTAFVREMSAKQERKSFKRETGAVLIQKRAEPIAAQAQVPNIAPTPNFAQSDFIRPLTKERLMAGR